MLNRRKAVVSAAAAAAAAAVAVAVAVGAAGPSPSGSPVTTDRSPSAGPRTGGAADAPADPGSDSSSSRPGTTAAGGSSGGNGGAETLPETLPETPAAPSGLPDVTAPTAAALPTWDGLASGATAARGRLVPGYPAELLPVAPRGSIVTSSLSPSTGRVQVALVARRSQSPAAVLSFYRARLARAGFHEHAIAAVGGASATAFTRDDNRVVITVDPGRAQTYSVQATFVTAKA
ncbi:hypothetical protein [Nocardioides conyzicola]|uniref:Uncharacterized protein n=1 Tax=Nocardioides conyzicola TaxID=1651781 RepID=A0ABP8XQ25_9ACTN